MHPNATSAVLEFARRAKSCSTFLARLLLADASGVRARVQTHRGLLFQACIEVRFYARKTYDSRSSMRPIPRQLCCLRKPGSNFTTVGAIRRAPTKGPRPKPVPRCLNSPPGHMPDSQRRAKHPSTCRSNATAAVSHALFYARIRIFVCHFSIYVTSKSRRRILPPLKRKYRCQIRPVDDAGTGAYSKWGQTACRA
jgi:hypothetical protein